MKKLLGLGLLVCGFAFAGSPIASVRTKHSVTNFPSTAWTTLVASVSPAANYVHVSNSSLSGTLLVAIGSAGNEVQAATVRAGENIVIPMRVVKYGRVSVKGADGTLTTGDSIFDFYE